jgi:hypothetical protein
MTQHLPCDALAGTIDTMQIIFKLPRCGRLKTGFILLCLLGASVRAEDTNPEPKKNYFDDPFFQVSQALANCPVPEGPMYTPQEQRAEAHGRIERGTSCYLAGLCKQSNAYAGDKALVPQVKAAVAQPAQARASSVWVIIQRRMVQLQGCVSTSEQSRALEAAARSVAEVDAVLNTLSVGTAEKPLYKLAPPAPAASVPVALPAASKPTTPSN